MKWQRAAWRGGEARENAAAKCPTPGNTRKLSNVSGNQ